MPLDIRKEDWRTEETNEKWRRMVAARYGEETLAEMLRSPTINQRCNRCLKHFGLECLCTRAELRAFARGEALVELGVKGIDSLSAEVCPECLDKPIAPKRTRCWACIKKAQRTGPL
jgi:hypothetical protein